MATEDFTTRILNRRPRSDYRNLRLSDFISAEDRRRAAAVVNKVWDLPAVSDQGNTPHCVGYAELNNGNCEPVQDGWANDMGDTLYYKAKEYDNEPNQENGSSTLSGVKAFMFYARLEGAEGQKYAFASSIEDIKVWVLVKSPVVTGTDWHNNMFYPDSNGVVHLGGGIAGGHEWLIIGYDRATDMFLAANSWGPGFGINGTFSISATDYAELMKDQGDAVTMIEAPAEPVPPPTPEPTPTPTPAPEPLPAWLVWLIQKIIEFLKSLLGG